MSKSRMQMLGRQALAQRTDGNLAVPVRLSTQAEHNKPVATVRAVVQKHFGCEEGVLDVDQAAMLRQDQEERLAKEQGLVEFQARERVRATATAKKLRVQRMQAQAKADEALERVRNVKRYADRFTAKNFKSPEAKAAPPSSIAAQTPCKHQSSQPDQPQLQQPHSPAPQATAARGGSSSGAGQESSGSPAPAAAAELSLADMGTMAVEERRQDGREAVAAGEWEAAGSSGGWVADVTLRPGCDVLGSLRRLAGVQQEEEGEEDTGKEEEEEEGWTARSQGQGSSTCSSSGGSGYGSSEDGSDQGEEAEYREKESGEADDEEFAQGGSRLDGQQQQAGQGSGQQQQQQQQQQQEGQQCDEKEAAANCCSSKLLQPVPLGGPSARARLRLLAFAAPGTLPVVSSRDASSSMAGHAASPSCRPSHVGAQDSTAGEAPSGEFSFAGLREAPSGEFSFAGPRASVSQPQELALQGRDAVPVMHGYGLAEKPGSVEVKVVRHPRLLQGTAADPSVSRAHHQPPPDPQAVHPYLPVPELVPSARRASYRGVMLPARASLQDADGLRRIGSKVQELGLLLPQLCSCNVVGTFNSSYVWRCGRNCPLYGRPQAYEALLNDVLVAYGVL